MEIKKGVGKLLEKIDNEMTNVQKLFQDNIKKKDSIAQKKKTKAYEKTSHILPTTIDMNLSKNIEEYQEKQRLKLEHKDIREFKEAYNFLEEIKTRWLALEDGRLESALERLKLVHSKEKTENLINIRNDEESVIEKWLCGVQ